VELVKKRVDVIALFITHFAGDSSLFFFDTTRLDYLRAIVTEEGIMSRIEILRRFKNMKVSKYFPT
jgi:methylthioribose-1-phosphate isomerase